MSFTPGERVVIKGTLAVVVSDETVADQEFVGVVMPNAIQYVPASQVIQPADQAGGQLARPMHTAPTGGQPAAPAQPHNPANTPTKGAKQ